MTDRAGVRVRQGFLKVSIVVFVLLVPCLLYAGWDYYESARMDRFLTRIDPDGTMLVTAGVRLTADEERADRLYRAAAVLASTGTQTAPETKARLSRLSTTAREDAWSADSMADLRAQDVDCAEALDFAVRAAALPFSDFTPGTSFSYEYSGLLTLQRFLGYRAMLHALSGDDQGAIDALVVEARLARTFDGGKVSIVQWPGVDAAQVLERVHARVDSLDLLADAFADTDQANDVNQARALAGLTRGILASSRVLADPDAPFLTELSRPISAHMANGQLDVMAETLPAARLPWPERVNREIAVQRSIGLTPKPLTPKAYVEYLANDNAQRVALFRTVRLALAVERFRRDHGALPPGSEALVPEYLPAPLVDPFSGRSLLLQRTPAGYTAYSVGANRADDGGAIAEPSLSVGGTPKDVGIRMRDR